MWNATLFEITRSVRRSDESFHRRDRFFDTIFENKGFQVSHSLLFPKRNALEWTFCISLLI